MSYEITLSADLKFIETWEIPYLLTQARYPYIPRAGVSAAEVLGKSETSDSAIVEFSDSDLALLDRVWLGRENWRTGIPLHAFADYLAAFNDNPERPVWNLRWIASGGRHLADRVELDAVVQRDIANGTLLVRRKSTLAVILPEDRMQDAHRTSVVSVEDFRLYARRFLIDVLTEKPDAQGHESTAPSVSVAIRSHRLKSRTNVLDAVIEMATRQATNPADYHSVWAELEALAESKHPPAPLLDRSPRGIQYSGPQKEKDGVPDVFTKNALRKRMNPNAR